MIQWNTELNCLWKRKRIKLKPPIWEDTVGYYTLFANQNMKHLMYMGWILKERTFIERLASLVAVFPVHAVRQAMTRDTLTSAAEPEQRTLCCHVKLRSRQR